MLIEMTIKGLMVDPVTNMPIVLLRDAESQRVLPVLPRDHGEEQVANQYAGRVAVAALEHL